MAIQSTKNREICIDFVDKIGLAVFSANGWTDADWQWFCQTLAKEVAARGAMYAAVNYAPGPSPTSFQRQIIVEQYGAQLKLPQMQRAVVLSDSILTRGALTAVSWLLPKPGRLKYRAFSCAHIRQALAWVGEERSFELDHVYAVLTSLIEYAGMPIPKQP